MVESSRLLKRRISEILGEYVSPIRMDTLERRIGENHDRYKEVLPVLRELQGEGGGEYVAGRKGRPSRFVPAGVPDEEPYDATQVAEPFREPSKFRLPLGNDRIVELAVPQDLTSDELELVSHWTKVMLKR